MKLSVVGPVADDPFNYPLHEALHAAARSSRESIEIVCCTSSEFLRKSDAPDGIIFSGVPINFSAGMILKLRKDYAAILSRNIQTLGICLGHQVVCAARGAEVFSDQPAEIGTIRVEVDSSSRLFAGLNGSFDAFAMHRCRVGVPPRDFTLLASSEQCQNHATGNGSAHTVQFHPERSGSVGQKILENWLGIVCEK